MADGIRTADSVYVAFYFRDGDSIRLGEVKINPRDAAIRFRVDGKELEVKPHDIIIAELPHEKVEA